jgi:hypothetical protein
MGTRNLTAVFYQGDYRIAQYGQWDGYPSGQGITALEFARDKLKRDAFLLKLEKLHDLTAVEREEIDKDPNWSRNYPHLSRDAGAEVLEMIQDGPDGLGIRRMVKFAGESLFCEYAYVIDFDKGTFEAFKGFNHKPLDPGERFASIPTDPKSPDYYQVKFWKSWPLDALPSNDDFLLALKESDEDEEAA